MGNYRPFHLPGCPARDPDVNVDRLRIGGDGTIETVRICTCPPERFGPGSKPIYDPGDEAAPAGVAANHIGPGRDMMER